MPSLTADQKRALLRNRWTWVGGSLVVLMLIGLIGNALQPTQITGQSRAPFGGKAEHDAAVAAAEREDEAELKLQEAAAEQQNKAEAEKFSRRVETIMETDLFSYGGPCERDASKTHWTCFYDGITPQTPRSVLIELTTDGGWSNAELKKVGEEAALHVFNFAGEQLPQLSEVLVKINGLDVYMSRDDVPLLNR